MVVGDNPEELMEKYNKSLKVEPYIKYKYLDAEKMKNGAVKVLSELIKQPDKFTITPFQADLLKERLKSISSMTSFEYYRTITDGLYYDKNGNALSEVNPKGKWDKYNIGKNFSYPLKLKDGTEAYQAKVEDILWDEMNFNKESVALFETIWELSVEDKAPENKQEETIKKMWENKKNYLSNFKTMDDFISHNCAYWTYAFLDKNGWVDMDDDGNESKWIEEYMERFINNLNDDELVTIFEYSISE